MRMIDGRKHFALFRTNQMNTNTSDANALTKNYFMQFSLRSSMVLNIHDQVF